MSKFNESNHVQKALDNFSNKLSMSIARCFPVSLPCQLKAVTDVPELQTLHKCSECSSRWVSPFTTCERCHPAARAEELHAFRENAKRARSIGIDRYNLGILAVLPDGSFVTVDYMSIQDDVVRTRDELVRKLTDTEAELRDVLAENARMRRRLETK